MKFTSTISLVLVQFIALLPAFTLAQDECIQMCCSGFDSNLGLDCLPHVGEADCTDNYIELCCEASTPDLPEPFRSCTLPGLPDV